MLSRVFIFCSLNLIIKCMIWTYFEGVRLESFELHEFQYTLHSSDLRIFWLLSFQISSLPITSIIYVLISLIVFHKSLICAYSFIFFFSSLLTFNDLSSNLFFCLITQSVPLQRSFILSCYILQFQNLFLFFPPKKGLFIYFYFEIFILICSAQVFFFYHFHTWIQCILITFIPHHSLLSYSSCGMPLLLCVLIW